MSMYMVSSTPQSVFTESCSESAVGLWSLITHSHIRLLDLLRETEHQIKQVRQLLRTVCLPQKVPSCKSLTPDALQTCTLSSSTCTCFLRGEHQSVGKATNAERLHFREQALITLLSMLGEDVQRYREDRHGFRHLTDKLTNGMPGHGEVDMGTDSKDMSRSSEASVQLLNGHAVTMDEEEKNWKANNKVALTKGNHLTRSGSVKNLIQRFSVSDGDSQTAQTPNPEVLEVKGQVGTEGKRGRNGTGHFRATDEQKEGENQSPLPVVAVTLPFGEAKRSPDTAAQAHPRNGTTAQPVAGTDYQFDREKNLESPLSEDEPLTPTVKPTPRPKYQLSLGANGLGNGTNGTLSKNSVTHRSMESLVFKDWDNGSERVSGVDSPPRVFNSPYSSIEYNPSKRRAEYKGPLLPSPATTEPNLFGLTRSNSSISSPTMLAPRARLSAYDMLIRRREQAPPSQQLLRNNMPNRRDYIEELTRQLEDSQRRNQFLEAESVEMEKERNQIRFEMRGLLVNNEDLLRMNTQLQGDMNRLRDRLVELESNNNVMVERFKQMELELKDAREVMVEANTQEYAFNFLQQSLKNKIHDAEEALEKETLHAQSLSEKLWLAERNLEDLQMERDTKEKKSVELNITVEKLETELAEALQQASQATTELNLQQKLRMDSQLRVEELEESLLEKDQEIQRLQQIISRLQGEVSDKLLDKERSLEEEIQLRERVQLQCKQAERTVEDLHMEIQTLTQAKEDLNKQLKQAQEKLIDLETDLEEMQENEQRWSNKHKRAQEQSEQLQLKLIQEKDLNDQLDCEKVILERQVRELRSEIEELQNNRVEEHVVTKAESKAKELENALRVEERSKVLLNNTISKLERKVNELTDQLEEENKTSHEQKELMTQKMRSLKRQLNDAEEEGSRRESQYRYTQRELADEREANARLQKQVMELQLQMKRKESFMKRQTLESLKLDVSEDEESEEKPAQTNSTQN